MSGARLLTPEELADIRAIFDEHPEIERTATPFWLPVEQLIVTAEHALRASIPDPVEPGLREAVAAHVACVCEQLTGEGPRPLGNGRVYHFQGCCADSDLAARAATPDPAEPRTYAWRPDYGPDGLPETALPERVVVGANGAYWRDYGQHYSMCPVSDDNDPVEVRAVYVRAATPDPAEPGLDVERLARAMLRQGWRWTDLPDVTDAARDIAAEYADLSDATEGQS